MMMQKAGRRVRAPIVFVLLTLLYYSVPWDGLGPAARFAGLPFIVLYAILLPGFVLKNRFDRQSSDPLETVTGAFVLGLANFLIVAFLWTLTDTNLSTFEKFLPLGLSPPFAIAQFRPAQPGGRLRHSAAFGDRLLLGLFGLVLAAIFFLVLKSGAPIDYTKDTLDHVGYVREIAETGRAFPTTAFYRDPGPNGRDIRKGLLHVFYGFATARTGTEAPRSFDDLNAVFAVALLASIYSVTFLAFGHTKVAVAAALIFLIGTGGGLAGALIRTSIYPNRFGIVFFLYFLVHATGFLDKKRFKNLFLISIFAFAASATHIFYAVLAAFAVLVIFAWKVCFPQHDLAKHIIRSTTVGTAALLGLFPYVLYRYLTAYPEANPLHSEVQGAVFVARNLFIAEPTQVIRSWGPTGLLTFLTIIPLWKERGKYPMLGYLLASLMTIPLVLFNPILLPLLHEAMTYLVLRLNLMCPVYMLTAFFFVGFFTRWSYHVKPRLFSRFLLVLLSVSLLFDLGPVFGRNTFSPPRLEGERAHSHLRWKDGLDFLDAELPIGSIIASDPLTSYSVPAFTPHHVLCTLDQHGPPNDRLLETRIGAARDIVSPYESMAQTVGLLERHGANYVVLNGRLPARLLLHYWSIDREIFEESKKKFARFPDLFTVLYDREDFVVLRWNGTRPAPDTAPANPYVVENLPVGYREIRREAGEASLEGIRLPDAPVPRGGRFECGLVWTTGRTHPPGNYVVSIRFDCTDLELPLNGRPFPKPWRKLEETITGRRYRFRVNHKIRGGLLSPDTWKTGERLLDIAMIGVPPDIAAGSYDVFVKMLVLPAQPNYQLRDLLYEDDVYQGILVGELVVK